VHHPLPWNPVQWLAIPVVRTIAPPPNEAPWQFGRDGGASPDSTSFRKLGPEPNTSTSEDGGESRSPADPGVVDPGLTGALSALPAGSTTSRP